MALADRETWNDYCRLAVELEGHPQAEPDYARGSMEWLQRQAQKGDCRNRPLPRVAIEAGCRRLARRGAPAPFAEAISPLGAAGSKEFDGFLTRYRGPQPLAAQADALEHRLVLDFEGACRLG